VPDLDDGNTKVVGLAAGIGFAIVATLVVSIAVGILLDQWLDTSPIFTLIGVGVGLIGAGYQLYELVRVSDTNRTNGPLGRSLERRLRSRNHNRS